MQMQTIDLHARMPSSNGRFDVLDYGAAADGLTDSTAMLQAAIDACAAAGGGTVHVPAGRYVTGTLWLRDHITLHLDAGSVLAGAKDFTAFPLWTNRWEGPASPSHAALISGEGLVNVAITGRGRIDGNGHAWWELSRQKRLPHFPPSLIRLVDCNNVLIDGIELMNSPAWAVTPTACTNVTITRLTIVNPPDSPNTDGINPDSCANVRISDCHIDVGDDCVSIKAGKENDCRERRRPSENITITNCTMLHGHGGVVIGSETSGSVRNVVISNCVFSGTDRGIRLKTRRGRGGVVEDVQVHNIVMDNVLCPIVIHMFYGCGAWDEARVKERSPYPLDAGTPVFRRLRFGNISARGAKFAAAFVQGLPEMPITDLCLHDISIYLDPHSAAAGAPAMSPDAETFCRAGMVFEHTERLRIRNVEIRDTIGPVLQVRDARNSTIVDLNGESPKLLTPAATLPGNVPHEAYDIDAEQTAEFVLSQARRRAAAANLA